MVINLNMVFHLRVGHTLPDFKSGCHIDFKMAVHIVHIFFSAGYLYAVNHHINHLDFRMASYVGRMGYTSLCNQTSFVLCHIGIAMVLAHGLNPVLAFNLLFNSVSNPMLPTRFLIICPRFNRFWNPAPPTRSLIWPCFSGLLYHLDLGLVLAFGLLLQLSLAFGPSFQSSFRL